MWLKVVKLIFQLLAIEISISSILYFLFKGNQLIAVGLASLTPLV